jgi:hypothetical protein
MPPKAKTGPTAKTKAKAPKARDAKAPPKATKATTRKGK